MEEVFPQGTVAVDRNLRTPYTQSWFLGIQQEITPNFVAQVTHAGVTGTQADHRGFDQPASVPSPFLPDEDNPLGRFNPDQPEIVYRANQGVSDFLASRRWS